MEGDTGRPHQTVPEQIYATHDPLELVLRPHENTIQWPNHISEKIYLHHLEPRKFGQLGLLIRPTRMKIIEFASPKCREHRIYHTQ